VHAYAQKHWPLNGPSPAMNQSLRKAVLESTIELDEELDEQLMLFLDVEEQKRIVREITTNLKVPAEIGINGKIINDWIVNLGWKVNTIPKDAKDVLVIGSASCREALFIRHLLPHAKITCVDFVDARIPNIELVLNIKFIAGDFNDLLASGEKFDVVFSNHVLEHLFDPGKTLRLIKSALRDRGCLISAMPLDGQPNVPFSETLNRKNLHPLDFCTVDVAHGWKTNITNLLRELRASGFSEINFQGRDKHYSVLEHTFPNKDAFERRARLGVKLNRIFFASGRGVLKKVFPDQVPLPVMKIVFGIERRFWFGSNRLKNEFSVECLVTAR
jgi:SAM-dependent methyltransferase